MRKFAVALTVLLLAACSEDTAAPTDAAGDLDLAAILAFDRAGFSEPGRHLVGIQRLPRELQLTAEQAAKIKALIAQFEQNTSALRDSLAAILRQAEDARKAGKSRQEVSDILAQGTPLRQRLAEAERALAEQILAVLTAEQRAWLANNQPTRCDRNTAALTEAQKTEIAALIAGHVEGNKGDLAALKTAIDRFRTAQSSGASRAQLAAIMEEIRVITERLRIAEEKLRAAIDAVLTPEQRASGCYRGLSLTTTRTSR